MVSKLVVKTFIHLNVNSLLPKIKELSNAAVILVHQNWMIPFFHLKYKFIIIIHFAVIGTVMGRGTI